MKLVARKPDLKTMVGFGYGTARREIAAGRFPPPRKLSDGTVGWLVSELQAWLATRPVAVGNKLRGEDTRVRRVREADAKKPRRQKEAADAG